MARKAFAWSIIVANLLVATIGSGALVAHADSASLAISVPGNASTNFFVGDPWTLSVSATSEPSSTFSLCATQTVNGAVVINTCTPNWGATDVNGNWNQQSNFPSSTIGSWVEWVTFPDGTQSNRIPFTVSPAAPIAPPAPTAALTADGGTALVTVPVGGTVNYAWSSTNATQGSSSLVVYAPSGNVVANDLCSANGTSTDVTNAPWLITTASGTLAGTALPCQLGYRYLITYQAIGAGGISSPVSVSVLVAPLPTATFTATANGSSSPLIVPVGTVVNYAWSSTNATAGSSSLVVYNASGTVVANDLCSANGTSTDVTNAPWLITTASGTLAGTALPCQLGYRYLITYQAIGAGGISSPVSVSVTVVAGSSQASTSTASLAISVPGNASTNFFVGDPWTLSVSATSEPSSTFSLCATQTVNGAVVINTCTPNWGATDVNGNWNQQSNFPSSTIGSWVEWVTFPDGTQSNRIPFTVSPAVVVTVNSGQGAGGGGGGGGGGSPSGNSTTTADIAISKTVNNSNPAGNANVIYTITVTALGPTTSSIVVAHDILPNGVSFVSATTSQGTYSLGTGNWTVGTLSAGATSTLVMTAAVSPSIAGQTVVNTATVSELSSLVDPNPANNSSSAAITVQSVGSGGISLPTADVSIAKVVDNTSPHEGDTIHYTLTVTALGPATSTGVVATDTLPSGLTFVSDTPSIGSYASSTGTWTIGNLSASSTATLVIAATVNVGSAGTTITNSASVGESSSTTDPNAANNAGTAPITVQSNTSAGCTSNCGGGGGGGGGGGSSGSIVGGGGSAYDLAIDGGAASTNSTNATLSLYGSGAYTMEVANDPSFASSTWIPYATTLPWTLTSGAGEKTVYVQYRSVTGSLVGKAQASTDLVTGQVLGATTVAPASAGQVLGASTSCGVYLDSYIKLGAKNDPSEVKKLQMFLNKDLGINLPITGFYGPLTYNAVNQFQVKYRASVLAPWVQYGLSNDMNPTGYVYKTTQREINLLECPPLNIPMPVLP